MGMRPLLSKTTSMALVIFTLSGVIFLSVLGVLFVVRSAQVTGHLNDPQIDLAARSCFIAAAVYGFLLLLAASQVILHWVSGAWAMRAPGDSPKPTSLISLQYVQSSKESPKAR